MKRLLIIDDDKVFAGVLKQSMAAQGYDVTTAHNAQDGLTATIEFLPEYVLLDLKIASDSGLKLIPQLIKAHPNLKIVILTGYANVQTAIEAIKLGAIHYLSKPTGISEIIAAFEREEGDAKVPIESEVLPLGRLEKQHIEAVLAKNGGNISQAARELKMHRRTLQRKLYKKA